MLDTTVTLLEWPSTWQKNDGKMKCYEHVDYCRCCCPQHMSGCRHVLFQGSRVSPGLTTKQSRIDAVYFPSICNQGMVHLRWSASSWYFGIQYDKMVLHLSSHCHYCIVTYRYHWQANGEKASWTPGTPAGQANGQTYHTPQDPLLCMLVSNVYNAFFRLIS